MHPTPESAKHSAHEDNRKAAVSESAPRSGASWKTTLLACALLALGAAGLSKLIFSTQPTA